MKKLLLIFVLLGCADKHPDFPKRLQNTAHQYLNETSVYTVCDTKLNREYFQTVSSGYRISTLTPTGGTCK